MTHAIETRDLWYRYDAHPVLTGVDLTVDEGDFVAVIGPNGGGKTTLLRLLLGLITPDQGEVRIFGEKPSQGRSLMSYVPQHTNINTDFPISVVDVVMMGTLRSGMKRLARRKAAMEALAQIDMADFAARRIGELSGGQRQRVLIARALVSGPRLLFLDEPTASIDRQGQQEFYELLARLNQTTTIVVVSHDFMALSPHIKSVACVNRELHYHPGAELTGEMLDLTYGCPVELVAHGVPHRVFSPHEE